MHVFLLAKALAKPFMNIAMPEPLQKPDASVSSISIVMLDRIYWRVFFTGALRLDCGGQPYRVSLFVRVSCVVIATAAEGVEISLPGRRGPAMRLFLCATPSRRHKPRDLSAKSGFRTPSAEEQSLFRLTHSRYSNASREFESRESPLGKISRL